MHLDYSTTLFYSSCKSYTTHFLAAMEHHIWHGNCKWQESPPENMYLHLKAEHQLVTNGKQTQLLCSYMQIIFHHTEGYILLLSQNLTPMGIPKGRSSRVQVTFTNLWNLMTKSSPHKSSPLHHMTQQLLAPVGQPQVWRHRTCLTMPRNGRRVTAIKDPSMKTRSDWHYSLSRTLIIEAIHLGNLLNP